MSETGIPDIPAQVTPQRSLFVPSAQLVALWLLGIGAFGLVSLIVLILVYAKPEEAVRTILASTLASILTILITITSFYFGSSLGSSQKNATISTLAGGKP